MLDKPIRAADMMPLDILDTPFNANFWISGGCNFRCVYCCHSLPEGHIGRRGMMNGFLSMDKFRLIADSMGQFPGRIVCASFCGIGEPLLHPHLPDMISILTNEKLVSATEVTTNAALLTPELSDRLIDAGISCLSVSIQGVDSDGYERICGRRIDVSELVRQLEYFYNHKKNTTIVTIKTLDICVKTDEEKKKFEELFRPIADKLHILHTVKLFQDMDYSAIVPEALDQFTGEKMHSIPYCYLPFSSIHLLPDGGISMCPLPNHSLLLGNIADMTLRDAWNDKRRLSFLLDHATCNKDKYEACRKCEEPNMLAAQKMMPPELAEKLRMRLNSL